MNIEEVKELIKTTKDEKILEALWELYDLKKQADNTYIYNQFIHPHIKESPTTASETSSESLRKYLNSGKPFGEPYRG